MEAVNGYKVKPTNFFTKEDFSGADIKSDFLYKSLPNSLGYYVVDCNLEGKEKFIANNLTTFSMPKIPTAGEIGYSCSHLKIWQEIVSNGYSKVLIFEDAAFIPANFLPEFSKLTKELDPEFDILYLFNYKRDESKTNILSLSEINSPVEIERQCCTHGYYLSNKGLEYAQGPGLFRKQAVDSFLSSLVRRGALSIYAPSATDLVLALSSKSVKVEMER